MKLRKLTTWLAALLGAALALGLVFLARPAEVWTLTSSITVTGLGVSFAWALLALISRGSRLRLIIGANLKTRDAVATIATTQLASALLPFRLGELALAPLLALAGVPGTVRALSTLVVLRVLDLTAILTMAIFASLAVGLSTKTAIAGLALLLPALFLSFYGFGSLLRKLTRVWRHAHGRRRRALMQLLDVHHELKDSMRSPIRGIGIVVTTFGNWVAVWGLTYTLLHAMNLYWTPGQVLFGIVGASFGAALPINSVGNFGTLEAGWTAALVTVGIPADQALASGFATHLWNLVFLTVLGSAALPFLAFSYPGSLAKVWRATLAKFHHSQK